MTVACFCGAVYIDQDACPACHIPAPAQIRNGPLPAFDLFVAAAERRVVVDQPEPGYGRPACS